jgi:hypothetical protein
MLPNSSKYLCEHGCVTDMLVRFGFSFRFSKTIGLPRSARDAKKAPQFIIAIDRLNDSAVCLISSASEASGDIFTYSSKSLRAPR